MNLTITDGFKFGCGLLLAGVSAAALLLLAVSLVTFGSAILGVRVPLPGQ
jgi:hypothetical protein